MASESKSATFTITLLFFIVLQLIFVSAERQDSAQKTALAFSRAYFMLDPGADQLLCSRLQKAAGLNPVDHHLRQKAEDARQMGFRADYMRSYLMDVQTKTLRQDAKSARVEIHALKKRYLNPVFNWLAEIFHLGSTSTAEQVLDLVKENGRWRVCGISAAAMAT